MFCTKCGKEFTEGANFCGGCGTKIGNNSSIFQTTDGVVSEKHYQQVADCNKQGQRQKVLEVLGAWSNIVVEIDSATDKTRLAIAQNGMHSHEFEEARIAAIAVVEEAQKQTRDYGFWPVLEDDTGAKLLLDLQMKVDMCYDHQLLLLRLQGTAAEAFRTGDDSHAPSINDIKTANENFERILDEIGKAGGKLARCYKLRGQDIQTSFH